MIFLSIEFYLSRWSSFWGTVYIDLELINDRKDFPNNRAGRTQKGKFLADNLVSEVSFEKLPKTNILAHFLTTFIRPLNFFTNLAKQPAWYNNDASAIYDPFLPINIVTGKVIFSKGFFQDLVGVLDLSKILPSDLVPDIKHKSYTLSLIKQSLAPNQKIGGIIRTTNNQPTIFIVSILDQNNHLQKILSWEVYNGEGGRGKKVEPNREKRFPLRLEPARQRVFNAFERLINAWQDPEQTLAKIETEKLLNSSFYSGLPIPSLPEIIAKIRQFLQSQPQSDVSSEKLSAPGVESLFSERVSAEIKKLFSESKILISSLPTAKQIKDLGLKIGLRLTSNDIDNQLTISNYIEEHPIDIQFHEGYVDNNSQSYIEIKNNAVLLLLALNYGVNVKDILLTSGKTKIIHDQEFPEVFYLSEALFHLKIYGLPIYKNQRASDGTLILHPLSNVPVKTFAPYKEQLPQNLPILTRINFKRIIRDEVEQVTRYYTEELGIPLAKLPDITSFYFLDTKQYDEIEKKIMTDGGFYIIEPGNMVASAGFLYNKTLRIYLRVDSNFPFSTAYLEYYTTHEYAHGAGFIKFNFLENGKIIIQTGLFQQLMEKIDGKYRIVGSGNYYLNEAVTVLIDRDGHRYSNPLEIVPHGYSYILPSGVLENILSIVDPQHKSLKSAFTLGDGTQMANAINNSKILQDLFNDKAIDGSVSKYIFDSFNTYDFNKPDNELDHIDKILKDYLAKNLQPDLIIKISPSSPAPAGLNPGSQPQSDVSSQQTQCVTGDTVLPILAEKSKVKGQKHVPSEVEGSKVQVKIKNEDIGYVQIKNIKSGEYVLSLNETTGLLEPHQIKALLDMGIKPVYKLTTEDGRSIKTTDNHPYLTLDGWKKVKDIKRGEEIAVSGLTSKTQDQIKTNQSNHPGNNGKDNLTEHLNSFLNNKINYYQKNTAGESTNREKSQPIDSHDFSPLLINNPATKNTADNAIPQVKETNMITLSLDQEEIEAMTPAPNQATPIFAKNSAINFLWPADNLLTINYNTTPKEDVKFVKITSIEPVGEEHVYDIEVEGTHNFVGGHYVNNKTGQTLTKDEEQDYLLGKRLPRNMERSDIVYGGIIAHNTYVKAPNLPTDLDLAKKGVLAYQEMLEALPAVVRKVIEADKFIIAAYTGVFPVKSIENSLFTTDLDINKRNSVITAIEKNTNYRVFLNGPNFYNLVNVEALNRVVSNPAYSKYFEEIKNDPLAFVRRYKNWRSSDVIYGLLSGYSLSASQKYKAYYDASGKFVSAFPKIKELLGQIDADFLYENIVTNLINKTPVTQEKIKALLVKINFFKEEEINLLSTAHNLSGIIQFIAFTDSDDQWALELEKIHNQAVAEVSKSQAEIAPQPSAPGAENQAGQKTTEDVIKQAEKIAKPSFNYNLRKTIEQYIKNNYRSGLRGINRFIGGYIVGFYRNTIKLNQKLSDKAKLTSPLQGTELVLAENLYQLLLLKKDKPVIAVDFGGGAGVSFIRLLAADSLYRDEFKKAVVSDRLILVVTNLVDINDGLINKVMNERSSYTGAAHLLYYRTFNEKRADLYSQEELDFIQSNQNHVRFVTADASELATLLVKSYSGKQLSLTKNIDLIHEENVIKHSQIPEIVLTILSSLLSDIGTFYHGSDVISYSAPEKIPLGLYPWSKTVDINDTLTDRQKALELGRDLIKIQFDLEENENYFDTGVSYSIYSKKLAPDFNKILEKLRGKFVRQNGFSQPQPALGTENLTPKTIFFGLLSFTSEPVVLDFGSFREVSPDEVVPSKRVIRTTKITSLQLNLFGKTFNFPSWVITALNYAKDERGKVKISLGAVHPGIEPLTSEVKTRTNLGILQSLKDRLARFAAYMGWTEQSLHFALQPGQSPFGQDLEKWLREHNLGTLTRAVKNFLSGQVGRARNDLTQCVTGDTLLPIVSRHSEFISESDQILKQAFGREAQAESVQDDKAVEYTQIKDVKPGQYVLSLNEQTGLLEPHQIKALLDMGVKPVYKLTTEDGREIRTTGNHPYLVRQKTSSLNQSDSGFSQNRQLTPQAGSGFNDSQKSQNHLNDFTFTHLSNQNNNHAMAFADTEAKDVSKPSVKTQQDSFVIAGKTENGIVVGAGKTGFSNGHNVNAVFTQAKNNISVNTLVSQEFEHNSLGGSYFQNFLFSQDAAGITKSNFSVGNGDTGVLDGNIIKTISPLQKIQNISNGNSRAFNTGLTESNGLLNDNSGGGMRSFINIVHNKNYYSNFSDKVSNSRWTKVIDLSVGDEIAVADADDQVKFVKIASIEPVGEEHVYDIEVEGTHNFVGNGIVAHNTYTNLPNLPISERLKQIWEDFKYNLPFYKRPKISLPIPQNLPAVPFQITPLSNDEYIAFLENDTNLPIGAISAFSKINGGAYLLVDPNNPNFKVVVTFSNLESFVNNLSNVKEIEYYLAHLMADVLHFYLRINPSLDTKIIRLGIGSYTPGAYMINVGFEVHFPQIALDDLMKDGQAVRGALIHEFMWNYLSSLSSAAEKLAFGETYSLLVEFLTSSVARKNSYFLRLYNQTDNTDLLKKHVEDFQQVRAILEKIAQELFNIPPQQVSTFDGLWNFYHGLTEEDHIDILRLVLAHTQKGEDLNQIQISHNEWKKIREEKRPALPLLNEPLTSEVETKLNLGILQNVKDYFSRLAIRIETSPLYQKIIPPLFSQSHVWTSLFGASWLNFGGFAAGLVKPTSPVISPSESLTLHQASLQDGESEEFKTNLANTHMGPSNGHYLVGYVNQEGQIFWARTNLSLADFAKKNKIQLNKVASSFFYDPNNQSWQLEGSRNALLDLINFLTLNTEKPNETVVFRIRGTDRNIGTFLSRAAEIIQQNGGHRSILGNTADALDKFANTHPSGLNFLGFGGDLDKAARFLAFMLRKIDTFRSKLVGFWREKLNNTSIVNYYFNESGPKLLAD
ncbi:hypothetical protein HY030_02075 [Candidatus Gottesmanbacteria bacterium]|nr:hypothetical protein [Candidatus Gottesmanbacteria bacterium]